jgi:hypothetical protein
MTEQNTTSDRHPPSKFQSALRECKLGVKALQNLLASQAAVDRLLPLGASKDWDLMAALFCAAVVRYAKPFVDSRGATPYPTKRISGAKGFDKTMHDHLLVIRKKLVAHDDDDYPDPRLLLLAYKIPDLDLAYPAAIALSNKCLAYPADWNTLREIREHVAASIAAIQTKLGEDLHVLRIEWAKDQKQADRSLRVRVEDSPSSSDWAPLPDYLKDEWLDVSTPNFSAMHDGFIYDQWHWKLDFHGKQEIPMPDGSVLEFEVVPADQRASR